MATALDGVAGDGTDPLTEFTRGALRSDTEASGTAAFFSESGTMMFTETTPSAVARSTAGAVLSKHESTATKVVKPTRPALTEAKRSNDPVERVTGKLH
jgi:hypothetical protein